MNSPKPNSRPTDPEKGPFSDIEMQSIYKATTDAFACGRISIREYVLVLLFAALGARSVQVSDLKVRDLMVTTSSDGSPNYILSVPRARMRGNPARWELTKQPLVSGLGQLVAHLIVVVKRDALTVPLHRVNDPLDLPLFPQWDSDAPLGFGHHSGSRRIAAELKEILGKLPIISERTGRQIAVTTQRFRLTLATRAAQEGFSKLVIARPLGHSDR